MNKVILIGNVGNDPEIKTLENGSKVANFSLATTEVYNKKNSSGGESEQVKQTTWHKIEVWNALATVAENHIKKGDRLSIDGKINLQKFTDKEGIERTSIKIRTERIELLGKKRDEIESKAEEPIKNKKAPKTPKEGIPNEKEAILNENVVFQAAPHTDDLPF